jgi:hypothetical protein
MTPIDRGVITQMCRRISRVNDENTRHRSECSRTTYLKIARYKPKEIRGNENQWLNQYHPSDLEADPTGLSAVKG